jgi:heme/copper-type cytochrome/quinol oxidase subunit 4
MRIQTSSRQPGQVLAAISWVLLIAVMVGGESLIMLLTSGDPPTAQQEQFFRAGHGHAGVLAIAGILYSNYLGRTALSARRQVVAWIAYALAVFMVSGGMFLHAYTGEAGERSAGVWLTTAGGVVLAGAVLYLAWHLFRARNVMNAMEVRA